MRRGVPLVLVLAAAAIAGCGSEVAWQRWQAERASWHANRLVDRIAIDPRLANPAQIARARQANLAIARRWPSSTWVPRAVAGDSLARDVARLSGRALLSAARLEELSGDTTAALARLADVERDYAPVWPLALEASAARVRALDRRQDRDAALAAAEALARRHPLVDRSGAELVLPVYDAALRVARDAAGRGRTAVADSAAGALERRLQAELAAAADGPLGPELWIRLAEVHASRRPPELDRAAAALRGALAERAIDGRRGEVMLGLATLAEQAGRPDSVRAWARRAQRGGSADERWRAVGLEARAWEASGAPDSAAAAWTRWVEAGNGTSTQRLDARFERARLNERLDRWDLARGELHAILLADPMSPRAFACMERLVRHHLDAGEPELAAIEADRSLRRVDDLLATVRDSEVLRRAQRSRAWLLQSSGRDSLAAAAWEELWRRWPDHPEGAEGALVAGDLATDRLNDPARAVTLWRELAASAVRDEDRRQAEERLARHRAGR